MKQIQNFLVETWKRLKGKTPSYFKVLNTIATICATITGLPFLLESHGIKLPPELDALANKTVAIASVVGLLVGKLTVQRSTLPNGNGIIEGATHAELPFTAKKEESLVINGGKPKE